MLKLMRHRGVSGCWMLLPGCPVGSHSGVVSGGEADRHAGHHRHPTAALPAGSQVWQEEASPIRLSRHLESRGLPP